MRVVNSARERIFRDFRRIFRLSLIHVVALRVNRDDARKVLHGVAPNRLGAQILIAEDFFFFDALGDQRRRAADSGKVDGVVAQISAAAPPIAAK